MMLDFGRQMGQKRTRTEIIDNMTNEYLKIVLKKNAITGFTINEAVRQHVLIKFNVDKTAIIATAQSSQRDQTSRRPNKMATYRATTTISECILRIMTCVMITNQQMVRFIGHAMYNVTKPKLDMTHHTFGHTPGSRWRKNKKRAHPELNQGPGDLQSPALTTELYTRAD